MELYDRGWCFLQIANGHLKDPDVEAVLTV